MQPAPTQHPAPPMNPPFRVDALSMLSTKNLSHRRAVVKNTISDKTNLAGQHVKTANKARVQLVCVQPLRRAGRCGDLGVGGGRVVAAEDGRARYEKGRAGLRGGAGGGGVDAAVHLDAEVGGAGG